MRCGSTIPYKRIRMTGGTAMDEQKLLSAGIDYDAALARFVGKRAIYEKYLAKFLEDEHARDAATAYENRNFVEVLEQTHALKGVAGTLGMTELYEISAEIVKDLRNDETDGLDEKLAKLLDECGKLKEIIKTA